MRHLMRQTKVFEKESQHRGVVGNEIPAQQKGRHVVENKTLCGTLAEDIEKRFWVSAQLYTQIEAFRGSGYIGYPHGIVNTVGSWVLQSNNVVAEALAVSLDKPFPWDVGFRLGHTKLSTEL